MATWEAVVASRGRTNPERTGGGQDCWNIFTVLGETFRRAVDTQVGRGSAYIGGNQSRKLRTGDKRMAPKTVHSVPSSDSGHALCADVCLLLRSPLLAFHYSWI